MDMLDSLLKNVNEEVTILSVCTRYRQSHKYLVTDGLVHYNDEQLTPREAYERFREEFPMFDVLSCSVSHRTPNPEGKKAYRWTTIEIIDVD